MSYWAGPMGWATGWATGLAHGLTHWASGLSMGLNNNGPGRPLARWTIGFLGQAMGHGLFDDP